VRIIPENTLTELWVPNERYEYFKGHPDHPFRDKARDFEAVNAWWLAEAAFLAYGWPTLAEYHFKNAGFTHCQYFTGTSTQCYIVHNDNIVIVAFRGSEISEQAGPEKRDLRYIIADWVANSRTYLVDSGRRGLVHQGFKEALDEVWERKELEAYIGEVRRQDGRTRTVWFTGHSLGAALATLAADRYGDEIAGLYTFGSPLVGDAAFANAFRVDHYRFVNNDDVVTKVPFFGIHFNGVPFPGSYEHAGHMKYLDRDGRLVDNPSLIERLKDNRRRFSKNMVDYLRYLGMRLRLRALSGDLQELELPQNFLTDHAPYYYAAYLRRWIQQNSQE